MKDSSPVYAIKDLCRQVAAALHWRFVALKFVWLLSHETLVALTSEQHTLGFPGNREPLQTTLMSRFKMPVEFCVWSGPDVVWHLGYSREWDILEMHVCFYWLLFLLARHCLAIAFCEESLFMIPPPQLRATSLQCVRSFRMLKYAFQHLRNPSLMTVLMLQTRWQNWRQRHFHIQYQEVHFVWQSVLSNPGTAL